MSLSVWSLGLLVVGLALLWWARKARRELGLPEGKVVYSDTSPWRKVEKPLFSPKHRLKGKPDYLVESEGNLIPVELKPLSRAQSPRPWDVMQLAAYCLLVEDQHGKPPPYGLLRYGERTFRVEYTRALRRQLLETLARMREELDKGGAPRQHQESWRCRSCGYQGLCDQSLQ